MASSPLADLLWESGGDENGVPLGCADRITEDIAVWHSEKEFTRPSRVSLFEFTLPLKVHFRYCWLFSGVPRDGTYCLGIDRKTLRENRTLMADGDPDLCLDLCCVEHLSRTDMKAFWLTTGGRLVRVDHPSEDIKFRRVRQQNLKDALSLWNTKPELCEGTMRTSAAAHRNLIQICEEARRRAGRLGFYNLYATYPLPVGSDCEYGETLIVEQRPGSAVVAEAEIAVKGVDTGVDLLHELQPLYAAYFGFVYGEFVTEALQRRVSQLGAQWLVQCERSELRFSLDLKRNRLTRMVVQLALFMFAP